MPDDDHSPDLEDHDNHLFQQALQDVTPLRPSKKHTSRPSRASRIHQPKPQQRNDACKADLSRRLSDPWDTSNIHAEISKTNDVYWLFTEKGAVLVSPPF